MSVFQKNDASDPSLLGIVFFAFLFAFVGAISGFLLLASIPLKSFESIAELDSYFEINPQASLLKGHCFEGPVTVTTDLVQKRDAFLKGHDSTIELTDGEINAWITSEFSKPMATFSLKDRPGVLILPDLPNFFIDESVGFTFRIPMEIIIYGKEYSNLMIVKGHFTEGAEDIPVQLQIETLNINEARIPLYEGWGNWLLVKLLKPYLETDEFIDFIGAWEEVNSVEVVANGIRLNFD